MTSTNSCMDKCVCNRWAFSLSKAFESDQFELLYRRSIQSVSTEDYEKIEKFRHKEDSLACLAGRLFLRQAVRRLTGNNWHEIEFGRTEKGKPFVVEPKGCDNFGINVSHQGDYTVFASSCTSRVGVDVMRLDMNRGSKSADEYIKALKKSASEEEFKTMMTQPTDEMKMTAFYRYWCLKEAVLKATGQGIVDDLSRYDFKIDHTERYRPGVFLTSTYVLEDGKRMPDWVFEESFVDNKHSIAVCREKNLPKQCAFKKDPETKLFFSKVDFDFLLDGSSILNPLPDDAARDYENFMQKPKKKF